MLLAALALLAVPLAAAPFSHALFDQVLKQRVDAGGRVDYPGLKAAREALDAYVDSLAQCSPRTHPARFSNPQHELAYWINAYNAFVLRGVIEAYPVASVADIGGLDGFFRQQQFAAGGERLTLDQIENRIIRPVYRDPRIHFAVNCGAASCPALQNRAFTGENLDSLLEAGARRFAADPRHVRLDRERSQLCLSQILNWYGQDFIQWFPARQPASQPTLIDYLLLYLPPAEAVYLRQHRDLKVVFAEYDWALNAQ